MPTKEPTSSNRRARYAVYFPTAVSQDRLLLDSVLESLKANHASSAFLHTLVVRGWLQILHGLSPSERAMMLRSLDIPENVIAQIDTTVPHPAFIGLATGAPAVDMKRLEIEPVAAPTPKPTPKAANAAPASTVTMSIPSESRLGSISANGGLA